MGALTPTKKYLGEFAGANRLAVFAFTPGSASDTITFTEASHGFSTIVEVISAIIKTGQDAALMTAHPTFSSLVVTITTVGADGLAATDWTGATGVLTMLVQ